MRKKLSLEDVRDFYQREDVRETEAGFEMEDEDLHLTLVLPKEFYLLYDGNLLDPMHMMAVNSEIPIDMICTELIRPLQVRFLCGHYEQSETGRYLTPILMPEKEGKCNAILIQAFWDVRDGSMDHKWNEIMLEMYGERILSAKCDADDYHIQGSWRWLIRVEGESLDHFAMYMLLASYHRAIRPLLEASDSALREFERQKEECRRRILEIVEPLRHSASYTIDASNEDETVVKQEVSPGHTKIYRFRHDKTGWVKCAEMFQYERKQ